MRVEPRTEFDHLENIANHFFGKIAPDIKSWPLKAERAIVYLEGYHLVGKVKFHYSKKMEKGMLPYFEFWKPIKVVLSEEEEFEAPEGPHSWEMEWG